MSEILKVEKMVSGGDCLGKINGKNVFVSYAIPGEVLEVEITKTNRDYDNAKIINILQPSPHRVKAFCPLYGLCGGCNMQHIDPDYQIQLRKNILQENFEREGLKCPPIEVISGNDRGYRSRIQLTDGAFNQKESNSIVSLDFCPIASEEINSYLKNTPQNQRPRGRVHIFGDSRVISEPKLIVAQEKSPSSKEITLKGKASSRRKEKIKLQKNTYFSGSNLNPKNRCQIQLNDKKIAFDVQGFFQSNLQVLEKTIFQLSVNMGGKNLLDMYSGCGTFSVFLSDLFENTCLVEHNRDAIVFAEENMAGKKHESYGLSGERWVSQNVASVISSKGNFDAVIVDPPRSGMEKSVCQWLCHSQIPQIRSVSCNPSTHARDACFLVKAGYSLSKLYLLDFYPHTAHIESLANFEYTK